MHHQGTVISIPMLRCDTALSQSSLFTKPTLPMLLVLTPHQLDDRDQQPETHDHPLSVTNIEDE